HAKVPGDRRPQSSGKWEGVSYGGASAIVPGGDGCGGGLVGRESLRGVGRPGGGGTCRAGLGPSGGGSCFFADRLRGERGRGMVRTRSKTAGGGLSRGGEGAEVPKEFRPGRALQGRSVHVC